LDRALALLKGDGLSASVPVRLAAGYPTVGSGRDLVEFFRSMARDWSGWEGTRTWESLGHELRLECTHDNKAQVQVAVFLSRRRIGQDPARWRAHATLELDAGSGLERAAEAIAELVYPSQVPGDSLSEWTTSRIHARTTSSRSVWT
jgi:uncharacterized protein DUF6228